MGILFILSGVFFVAGVLDPPILPTWGGPATGVMATASAHRTAWFASTWLITLSIVAGLAAVELLARALGTDLARAGRSLYLAGSALGLASATYELPVTSTLPGAPRLPGWYFGIQHWADSLGTARSGRQSARRAARPERLDWWPPGGRQPIRSRRLFARLPADAPITLGYRRQAHAQMWQPP